MNIDRLIELRNNIKFELLHLTVGIVYFFCLYRYNRYLLSHYKSNEYLLMILENLNYVTVFFVGAVIMVILAVVLVSRDIRCIKDSYLNMEEIIYKFLGILIEGILIILTLYLIYNPILRGILACVGLLKVLTTA